MQSETRVDMRVKINTSIAGNVTKLQMQEPFGKETDARFLSNNSVISEGNRVKCETLMQDS